MGRTVSNIDLVVGIMSHTHFGFVAIFVVVYVALVAVCGVEVVETGRS